MAGPGLGSGRSLCLVGLIASALLAAAPARGDEATDWAAIEAAAKQEGKVVVYSSATSDSIRNIGALFQQKYGVQFQYLQIRGSEMRERLRTEHVSGRRLADVVDTNDAIRSMVLPGTGDPSLGVFAAHPPLPNAKQLVAPWKDDGTYMPVYLGMIGLMANPQLVSPQDEPKHWADLLDPKWKGKIVVDDPRAPGAGNTLLTVLFDAFGQDYLQKLAAQDLVMSRQLTVAARQVAQGEYAFYLGFPYRELDQMKGLPAKAVTPEEGASVTEGIQVKISDAPHPNAAALFLNFMLSDAAQDMLVEQTGSISVTGRLAKSLAPELRKLTDAKILGKAPPENAGAAFTAFNTAFGAPARGR